MKTIKLLFIFLFFSSFAIAQNGIIKGRIVDNDQQPLPGANIILNNSIRLGTVSNVNGEYFFNKLAAGEYTIEVSYIGFSGAVQSIVVEAGKTVTADFILEAGIDLDEVIINSRLAGESKALNTQKTAINITNILSSEQLERFPDANIGDALKRIPGINVQYDQGEARFGNIRGTAPELNSITINGERIPSAEAEIRSVQLDLVSSDMIETVEFNKAVTPDMDADAIGGSVNLVTKQAPYKSQISGKVGSGYNFVSEKLSFKGNLAYSDRFLNDKLGMVLSLSAYDNKLGSDDLEAEWDYEDNNGNDLYDSGDDAFASEIQNRQYYLERFRQSYSASFDYKFNERHQIYFNGIYNKRNDWENRYRLEVKDIADNGDGTYNSEELVRQTKFGVEDNKFARLEDQRMMSFGLSGEHLFGKIKIDWMAAYSKASEERPNERYIEYVVEDDVTLENVIFGEEPSFTIQNPNYRDFSSAWEFGELTEEYQYTEEIDMNFRLNFELPLMSGDFANKLKFGVRYRDKEKNRDNWLKEYSPLDEDAFNAIVLANLEDVTKDNYMAGDYELGNYVNPEISDKFDLYDTNVFEEEDDLSEEAGDFDATEDIIAGYLMFTQNIKEKFTIIAGVRVEQTNLEYEGKQWDNDNEILTATPKESDNYLSILPGLHLNYELTKNSNIRFAWTNTIARPNYFDLVPYVEIDEDEIAFGNPELEPTKSMNFDLMYEHFFKSIGLASAGVFYKDLTDVIGAEFQSDLQYGGNTYDEARTPMNIADATLLGIEAAFNRRLDFLPSFLKNLTFYGNYTYVKSKLDNIEIPDREDDDIPLTGSPEHTYNLSLAYDTKKFDVRVSFNHASAFLNAGDGGLGSEAFYDEYYDMVNYLDINADYSITDNWMVYLNANNLLNQPLRTYWGDSERTMQAEYYGVKYQLGLKFKF